MLRVAPEAVELIEFVRMIKYARERYFDDQEARLTDTDVAAALKIAPQEVRRVAELLRPDYDSGVYVSGQGEGWSLKCEDGLVQWDGLVGIADYLSKRDARRKEKGWHGV